MSSNDNLGEFLMAKKIFDDLEDDTSVSEDVEVDDELIEEFSSKLEKSINKILEKHTEKDPRLELLITLGSFCTQVAIDSGFDRKDFAKFMEDMFDDYLVEEENEQKSKEIDKTKFN